MGSGRWSAIVLGGLLLAVASTSCSSSTSTSPPTLTADEVTRWFSRATEIVLPCEAGSKSVGDALAAEEASNDNELTSLPIVMAAGQAVEDCLALLDTESDPIWEPLHTDWPAAGVALRSRAESLLAVDEAALLAAATNLDNRALVGRVYESARAADAAAVELEEQVRSVAASVGLEVPAGETLYRWNPPNH